jgi:hypothetical protein
MNYEEKYKEALERARKFYNELAACRTKQKVAAIFPELAESEDEVIMKALIDLVSTVGEYYLPKLEVRNKMLAYLEKQKAKEKQDRMMPVYNDRDSFESALEKAWKSYNESGARTVDGCEDDYVECAHAKGFREGYLFGIEKQKEQKQTDLPEGFYYIDLKGNRYYSKEFRYGDMKLKVGEQKPADLSEMMVHKEPYIAPVPTPMVADEQKEQKLTATINGEPIPTENYSVNIPLAEWSEEDEKMIERLITRLTWITYNTRTDGTSPNITFFDEIDWLKSLRPSWKPSEEQMTNLLRAEGRLRIEGESILASKLAELYEQLKKL